MFGFVKIYIIIHLILYIVCMAEELLSGQSKDNNIEQLDDNKVIINDQFITTHLSDQRHLENPLVKANEIEKLLAYDNPNADWDTEEKLLQNPLFKVKGEHEENSCLLDSIKSVLKWWSYRNGTLREKNIKILQEQQQIQLDLSYRNISKDNQVLKIVTHNWQIRKIVIFSLAYNNFELAPYQTLQAMANSLKYLSLMGNPFIRSKTKTAQPNTPHYSVREEFFKLFNYQDSLRITSYNRETLAWATFPFMPALIELDISDCGIEFIDKDAFQNLTNLKNLYMSHNKMLTIPSDTFYYTPSLQVLDLSFTNAYYSFMNQVISSAHLESIMKFIYGVNIQQNVFRYLPHLVYLDLSHSKLSRSSAVAFTYIGSNLKYLSLCYTSFPVFGNGILRNSSIIGLDLSGNANAIFSISEDVFEGLSDSLSYLYFENANLRDLSWLKPLHKLRVLALAGNNINTLSQTTFRKLKELEILDLTSNQVGNWYSQVFKHNKNLRVLGLRSNNVNFITSEMLKDFSLLVYLSMGNNNFICDCLLHDLVDVAFINNQQARCIRSFWQDLVQINSTDLAHLWQHAGPNISYIVKLQLLQKLKNAAKKMLPTPNFKTKPRLRFTLKALKEGYNASKNCFNQYNSYNLNNEKINISIFKVQLLDYDQEHYWCYNETKRQYVTGLNCQRATLLENIEQELSTLTTCVSVSLSTLVLALLIGVLIYTKRWHIYYYYSSLKSAALLSSVSQDNLKKFNSLNEEKPNMIYDIFISYCESDRDWIVEELIPNVENTGDISICLHERDFQIGVTILDNIVSCMERSKALMLIISPNFLLSHWCQFEMQLAQFQIFDLSKDHLVLVLLEDIPRSKRPKNLQFLMNIKTYIKWPGGKAKKDVHPEERKLFWKRMRRTLRNIGLPPAEYEA